MAVVPLWACTTGCRDHPVASLAELSDADLIERFEELHQPVYEVYGLGVDRDEIHRHLASSFAGEALTREYVEHFTTLTRMQREQTSIDVLRVDYEDVHLVERSRSAAKVDADWSVSGLVTHQGHRHPRINRYRATYTLAVEPAAASTAAALRIVDTRVRSAERQRSALPAGALEEMPRSAAGTLSMEELLRSGLAQEILEAKGKSPERSAAGPEPP